MQDKTAFVVIVILNWNGLNDTIECLDSLAGIDYKNVKVVVIDNGSEKNEVAVLEANYQWLHIIKNSTNDGFAGGNNIGIKYALGIGADFVLLLNNDIIVASDFLSLLIETTEKDNKIGLLTPTIFDYYEPNVIQNQGMYIGWYGPPRKSVRVNPKEAFTYIETALGACLLIKRGVFERIGLLCEEYFYQVEDTDFCTRAGRQGFNIVCVPASKIWHKGSVSLNKVPSNKLRYFVRNRFIFRAKYATNFQLVVFLFWFFLIELPSNLIYYLIKFRKVEIVQGLYKGALEGIDYLISNRILKRRGI